MRSCPFIRVWTLRGRGLHTMTMSIRTRCITREALKTRASFSMRISLTMRIRTDARAAPPDDFASASAERLEPIGSTKSRVTSQNGRMDTKSIVNCVAREWQ